MIMSARDEESGGRAKMVATVFERGTLDPVGGRRDEQALPLAVECLLDARTADAVFVTAPGGRVVYWDPKAETLTGLPAGEVVGRPCREVLSGEREDGARLCGKRRESRSPKRHVHRRDLASTGIAGDLPPSRRGYRGPGKHETGEEGDLARLRLMKRERIATRIPVVGGNHGRRIVRH